jgi:hypothetical protein
MSLKIEIYTVRVNGFVVLHQSRSGPRLPGASGRNLFAPVAVLCFGWICAAEVDCATSKASAPEEFF